MTIRIVTPGDHIEADEQVGVVVASQPVRLGDFFVYIKGNAERGHRFEFYDLDGDLVHDSGLIPPRDTL